MHIKGSMDFRIKSKGRASHSSIPFLGQNAIKPLLEFIQNINQEYEKIMQTVKGESLDFSNMINKLENQLPSHITKEKAQELIQGLVMTNSIVQGEHKLIQYLILQQLNLMYAQYQNIIITKLKRYLMNI